MKEWIKQPYAQKGVAIVILIIGLFLLRHVLNLILLTFIFTYLFNAFYVFLRQRIGFNPLALLLLIYGTFLSLISILGYKYAPLIVQQLGEILTQVAGFKFSQYEDSLHPKLYQLLIEFNVGHYVREMGNLLISNIANISSFALQVVVALALSFFFILDKEKIKIFLLRFEKSNVSFLYKYYREFGKNFLNTFGKVVHVQLMIATANAILSFFGLWLLGFPHLLGLTIMIFFLGLIPVAGVLISLLPLSVIAFQIGGWVKIFHVLIMITVVHAMENYFLNPKLYSMKMKLPIFFTFSILIVSEHLMGVWGLLLGIPLFMFLLDMMKFPKEN